MDFAFIVCAVISAISAGVCIYALDKNQKVLGAIIDHMDEWQRLIDDSAKVAIDCYGEETNDD